jgi:hypothetical protein
MRIDFLYPGIERHDALRNWVHALARHAPGHEIRLDTVPVKGAEVYLFLTQARNYPRDVLDLDTMRVQSWGAAWGVLHNEDNPGVPTPGAYPSFCWTRRSQVMLDSQRYLGLRLARQPYLPPVVPWEARPLHLGTFGHCEPKKGTLDMARWAKRLGLPFTVLCPEVLARQYDAYIGLVKGQGARVRVHPWADEVEGLAPWLREVSHLVFVLPAAKGGTGGSPTSPRYATAFNRPVIVVDDEDTLTGDGFYVYDSLPGDAAGFEAMTPPGTSWGPQEYLDEVCERTLAFWGKS